MEKTIHRDVILNTVKHESNVNDDRQFCEHEQGTSVILQRSRDDVIRIGPSVSSEEEAYTFYNKYAIERGFSIRKHVFRRNKEGKITTRTFVCSNEGVSNAESENRLDTRTTCEAFIRFKEEGGIWSVVAFYDEHNHEMAADDEKHLLRSGRKIEPADASVISSMVDAGFGPAQTFAYIASEKGGETKVLFTLEDLNNHIRTKKKVQLEAGDAQSPVNHFCIEQQNDPLFFYTVQFDEDSHMTNFFWRDGKSLIDNECFGDVIIFDTTFQTNNYGMICAPFTGINHHKKNVVFGCAFLFDETIETFVWLFKNFLQAMGNRHPTTIFNDQSQAMANAIKEVFPDTRHRLCLWHLSQNAGKHLSHQLSVSGFKDIFNKFVYGCGSELEFEETWSKMIADYDLTNHKCLARLYERRSKWCPAFSQDIFFAGVRSTQRSESTNSVIRKISCKTMPLSCLVHHVQKVAERWRSKERKLDFRCRMGKPKYAARDSGILRQAAEVYTLTIFDEFKKEFYDTLHLIVKCYANDDNHFFHVIQQETKTVEFVVMKFAPLSGSVTCICKKFESKGLLCCHALKVLNLYGMSLIPSDYILKRWTKDVKKGARIVECASLNDGTSKHSVTLTRSYLMQKAYMAINQSVLDFNGVKIAEKYLSTWLKEIENHVANINLSSDSSSSQSDDDGTGEVETNINQVLQVKNPTTRRPLGESNARLKGALEKRKKSTSKGHTCKYINDNPCTFAQVVIFIY
ncbi:protein FAR1-RELATED SEQUENCE 5-like [Silene latifolia]|uniref:protein FAR1-RELATED SEQUENCE 5-like n=1 Tax=Silene latifolia TaxID=37657 RepID=UPI003D776D5B